MQRLIAGTDFPGAPPSAGDGRIPPKRTRRNSWPEGPAFLFLLGLTADDGRRSEDLFAGRETLRYAN